MDGMQTLTDRAMAEFKAMTPEQQAEHRRAQRASFIRGMTTPCCHGVLDFEQCAECRK
jgi:hypothetical protein